MLVDLFNKEPRCDVDPDEAVAMGAAVQAGIKSGQLASSGLIVTDVAPFSMGIAVAGERFGDARTGLFHPIIPRNTIIPASRTDQFCTCVPGQTAAEIEIYQGEHDLVKYNHCLGTFKLEGIPRNWSKNEVIDVTYSYNLNGILEVTAKCATNKKEARLTVHDALERETQQAFAESLGRIAALYESAPSTDDETDDDELLDFDDDDEDYLEEEQEVSTKSLKNKLDLLKVKVATLMQEGDDLQQKELQNLMRKIEQMQQIEDVDKLQEIIDEATDILIDIDMREE
jgi:molecular chaperone DnaK